MKYRLIATLLLLVALGAAVVLTDSPQPPAASVDLPLAAPADGQSFGNLKIP